MRAMTMTAASTLLAVLAACTKGGSNAANDTGSAIARDSTVTPSAMNADVDRATGGSGLPAGFVGRTDNPAAPITGARYTANGAVWDVVTGPAHIVYRPGDVAMGTYTVSGLMVNGKQVASASKVGLPTEGIGGVRVNHNLHVRISPVSFSKPL